MGADKRRGSGGGPDQPSLLPGELAEHPVEIGDVCEKCGEPRDKLLVRLFETIQRLRSRLAQIDPGGELL